MRKLLIGLGLYGLVCAFIPVSSQPPNPLTGSFIVAGAVCLALGLATCDIVRALGRTSQRQDDQSPRPDTRQQ